MLQRIKSIFFAGIFGSSSSIEPRKTLRRFSEKLFKAELILVADIANESVSTEKVLLAPNFNAVKDNIPLPQPTSAIVLSRGGSLSKASMHKRVEGWLPVPKALPGSKRIIFRAKNFWNDKLFV